MASRIRMAVSTIAIALYVAPLGLRENTGASQWLAPLAKLCRCSAARVGNLKDHLRRRPANFLRRVAANGRTGLEQLADCHIHAAEGNHDGLVWLERLEHHRRHL
jgi:hypothetical protein